MDKEIRISRADLLREPEVRRFLPNPSQNVDFELIAKRSHELEEADESDIVIFEGMRYKIRTKNFIGSETEGAVEFGLLVIGQINFG
jgi:hypothetical protein